ncbi:OLC1v1025700C1 [Oldenlandia corymbosa var. corymbosa]|uniref:OLC1v1025700C1 n=1 Tax=Oldenlandia corymbosa var. corymbosa TaxID=529605 RepID=A0AAV1C5D6_OLDCO|nr:OLC1v1025700C1 [Oldenlandia corymbosa var. corymbosa]
MVRLYSRETICAFYYVEPLKDLSSTLYELTENAHMKEFLKVLGGQRMIDVYVCHMTEADAKEKLIRDEEKMFDEFMKEEYGFVKADKVYIKKQSSVVIEEIGEERHFTAKHVTPKSRRQNTQSALQLICWKDSDDSIEDKEFLDFLELPFKKDRDTVVAANGDDESVVGGGAVEENVSEGDDCTVEENVNDSLVEAAVLQTFVEPPEAEKVRETSVEHAETSVTAPVTEENDSAGIKDIIAVQNDSAGIEDIIAVQNDSAGIEDVAVVYNDVAGLEDDDAINIDTARLKDDDDVNTDTTRLKDDDAINTDTAGLDSDDVVDTDAVGSEDVAAVNPSDAVGSEDVAVFPSNGGESENEPPLDGYVPAAYVEPSLDEYILPDNVLLDDFDETEVDPMKLMRHLCRADILFSEYLQTLMQPSDVDMDRHVGDDHQCATSGVDLDSEEVYADNGDRVIGNTVGGTSSNPPTEEFVNHDEAASNDDEAGGSHSQPIKSDSANGEMSGKTAGTKNIRANYVRQCPKHPKPNDMREDNVNVGLHDNPASNDECNGKQVKYPTSKKMTSLPNWKPGENLGDQKKDVHITECELDWENRKIRAKWFANRYTEKIKADPKIPVKDIRYCVQHIRNNYKRMHPGETLKEFLWGIASSTTEEMYDQKMQALKAYDFQAYKHLEQVAPKRSWVKAFWSTHTRCDTLVINMCETLNAKLVEARELAILCMLEEVKLLQYTRIQKRGEWIESYPFAVPPLIKEIIDETVKLSKRKQHAQTSNSTQAPTTEEFPHQGASSGSQNPNSDIAPNDNPQPQVRRSTRVRERLSTEPPIPSNERPSSEVPEPVQAGAQPVNGAHSKKRKLSYLDKVMVNENAEYLGDHPPYKVGRWARHTATRVGKRDNYA